MFHLTGRSGVSNAQKVSRSPLEKRATSAGFFLWKGGGEGFELGRVTGVPTATNFFRPVSGLPRFRTLSQEHRVMAELNDVLREALSLGLQDRASLAEQLLASLDQVEPRELDKIWEDEAEKRLRSLRSGSARTVSADLVHEKANKIFDRS